MSSNEAELPLQPTPNAVVNEHARAGARAATAGLIRRLKGAPARAQAAATAARKRLLRASLEARAVARSSAAISGLEKDLRKARDAAGLKAAQGTKGAAAVGLKLRALARSFGADIDRLGNELPGEMRRMRAEGAARAHALAAHLKGAEARGKKAVERSSLLTGIAIDSRRIARRVRTARERRRMAH